MIILFRHARIQASDTRLSVLPNVEDSGSRSLTSVDLLTDFIVFNTRQATYFSIYMNDLYFRMTKMKRITLQALPSSSQNNETILNLDFAFFFAI